MRARGEGENVQPSGPTRTAHPADGVTPRRAPYVTDEDAIGRTAAEIEALSARVAGAIDAAKGRLSDADGEIAALGHALADARREIEALAARLAAATRNAEALRAEAAALKQEGAALRREATAYKAEAESWRTQLYRAERMLIDELDRFALRAIAAAKPDPAADAAAPEVSVITPVFNRPELLVTAVRSVLAQRFANWELIIVDDGSTDETPALLARRGDALRVIRQANAGMSAARNTGIAASRGEFVAFLDSDDWWRPHKLAQQVALLDAEPDIGFCSHATELQSPEGVKVGEWDGPPNAENLVARILGGHSAVAGGASSVMVRRALLERTGGFDARLRGAEDTDQWVRLAAAGRYACLPDLQVVVTRNPGSVSRNREAMRRGALDCLDKNRALLPVAQQSAFWRSCRASVLADYAKWRYRDGERAAALRDLAQAFALAPLARGRLILSLALAMLTGRPV